MPKSTDALTDSYRRAITIREYSATQQPVRPLPFEIPGWALVQLWRLRAVRRRRPNPIV